MYAKFYEEAHNSLVSIMFTSLFPYLYIVTLTFDPKKVNPLPMANIAAKFYEAYQGLVSIMFTIIFPYLSFVTLTFDLQN